MKPAAYVERINLIDSFVNALGSRFNELGDGVWLRFVNRVTPRHLRDPRAGALGHGTLSRRRNHFVLSGDQIPTGFGFPCGASDRATERANAPRHLRISQERGSLRVNVRGK